MINVWPSIALTNLALILLTLILPSSSIIKSPNVVEGVTVVPYSSSSSTTAIVFKLVL